MLRSFLLIRDNSGVPSASPAKGLKTVPPSGEIILARGPGKIRDLLLGLVGSGYNVTFRETDAGGRVLLRIDHNALGLAAIRAVGRLSIPFRAGLHATFQGSDDTSTATVTIEQPDP